MHAHLRGLRHFRLDINTLSNASCVKIAAYEYIPDSEITGVTLQSGSEEDLLDKVYGWPRNTERLPPAGQSFRFYTQYFKQPPQNKTKQTLSIDEPSEFSPKIVRKLPKVIKPKGNEVVKLEVKVTGKPKPEVKWFKQGEELFPSEEYQMENFDDGTSVLVINNVYEDDTGDITFEAHNALGVAITTTELTVEGIFAFRVTLQLNQFYCICIFLLIESNAGFFGGWRFFNIFPFFSSESPFPYSKSYCSPSSYIHNSIKQHCQTMNYNN